MGRDFRAAYAPDVSLTGTGQSVALVEFDSCFTNDIINYEKSNNLPNVPLKVILLDGFSGVPNTNSTSANIEVALDIEMVISMAPGISNVVLCLEAGPSGNRANDVFQRDCHQQRRQGRISCSWINLAASDTAFQEMAAQGQSFFHRRRR